MRLESCARVVAPRRPFAMADEIPRSGAGFAVSVETQNPMAVYAESGARDHTQGGEDADGEARAKVEQEVGSGSGTQGWPSTIQTPGMPWRANGWP